MYLRAHADTRSSSEKDPSKIEARNSRFMMARSLIQCGLVEQGDVIVCERERHTESVYSFSTLSLRRDSRLSLTGELMMRDLNGEMLQEKEPESRPRFVSRSTTASLFDNIFNGGPGAAAGFSFL